MGFNIGRFKSQKQLFVCLYGANSVVLPVDCGIRLNSENEKNFNDYKNDDPISGTIPSPQINRKIFYYLYDFLDIVENARLHDLDTRGNSARACNIIHLYIPTNKTNEQNKIHFFFTDSMANRHSWNNIRITNILFHYQEHVANTL